MRILHNITANYLGRAYSIAAIYLFVPFYVKILGIEAYGVIAFYTILLTISGLADIGLSATFAREAARSSDKRKLLNLLSTIERVLYLATGFVALIIFFGAQFIAENWLNAEGNLDVQTIVWSLRIMALMIIPQLGISLYTAGLIGLQRQVKANIIQSLFVTFRSGLVVLPILWWPQLPVFFAWQLAATIVFVFIIRASLVKAMGFPRLTLGHFDLLILKANMAFAGGMLWISAVAGINTQIDKLFVSKLFALTDFGYYTLASALAQVPVALATPIAVAFYPYVTKLVANGDADQEKFAFETYGQWITLVGATGAIGIFLFAPQLLALWLQDPTLPPLIAEISGLLAIGSLFLCLAIPSYYLGLAHGQSGLIALLATMTLLLSIPSTIVSIQVWGLRGAAFPWIALNLINMLLVTTFVSRRHLGRHYLSRLARTLGLPVGFALLPLLGARLIVDTINASPFFALALAGVGALCSLLAFGALRHFKLVGENASTSANDIS